MSDDFFNIDALDSNDLDLSMGRLPLPVEACDIYSDTSSEETSDEEDELLKDMGFEFDSNIPTLEYDGAQEGVIEGL